MSFTSADSFRNAESIFQDQLQYDKDQFNSSMYWWSNHYQEPADYKSDLPWK